MNRQGLINKKNSEEAGIAFSIGIVISILGSVLFTLEVANLGIQNTALSTVLNYTVGSLAMLLTLIIMDIKNGHKTLKLLLFFDKDKRDIVPLIMIFIGFIFGLGHINDVFVMLLESFGFRVAQNVLPPFSIKIFILEIVCICIIPAVCEELFFRGYLLRRLKRYGETLACVIVAIMFALYHLSIVQTVYQFLVGFVFAVVASRTKSIWPTIIMHFLNNLFVLVNFYFIPIELNTVGLILVSVVGLVLLYQGLKMLKKRRSPFVKLDLQNSRYEGQLLVYGSIGLIVALLVYGAAFYV